MHEQGTTVIGNVSRPPAEAAPPFGSNSIRLSARELILAGMVLAILLGLAPRIWERIERFEPTADYRLPYASGSDYWQYDRWCRRAAPAYQVLLLGDSVVWGHYVDANETLSADLKSRTGRDIFANMGVDGIHPVAMAGLLQYYARSISKKNVILHLNPLWMTSPRNDLTTEKETSFNHPRLVPQFVPKIPCYKAPYSERFSAVAQRRVRLRAWTSHLAIRYFDGMSLPAWTVEHPCENPFSNIVAEPADLNAPDAASERRNTSAESIPWVDLESSLQWRFFRRSVEMLEARGNTVFVLVGPFNEHMLTAESLAVYRRMQSGIEAWLRRSGIPYCMPPALPAELYVDASHPDAEGYDLLAQELLRNKRFESLLDSIPDRRSPK